MRNTDVFFCRPDPDGERKVYVIKYRDHDGVDVVVGKAKRWENSSTGYLQIKSEYEKYILRILDAVKKLGIERSYRYNFEDDGLRVCVDPEIHGRFVLYDQINGQKKQIGLIWDKRKKIGRKVTGHVYISIISSYRNNPTVKHIQEEFGTHELFNARTKEKLNVT